LTRILKVHSANLESKMITTGNSKGIPQGYLEWCFWQLAEEGIEKILMDMLALTLYGVMLFPDMENIIDHIANDVFVAYKNHSESPVITILAYV